MEEFGMSSSLYNDFPELLKIDSPKSIHDVRGGLEKFIQTEQELETAINLARERCDLSKIKVEEAKKYDDAWYKIGSTKMESLQYGQSLTFQFQKDLAGFCTVCLGIAKGHQNKLNDLADIIVAIHEQSKKEPMPKIVLTELDKLRMEVEREKNIIKSRQEVEREKILLRKKYIKFYLPYALICLVLAMIVVLYFVLK